MKNISDYIVIFESVITDALCDALLNEYKNCEDWVNAQVKNGENLNIRNCQSIGISFSSVIEKNFKVYPNYS